MRSNFLKQFRNRAAWLVIAGGLAGCGPGAPEEETPARLQETEHALYEGDDPKLVFRYRASTTGTSAGVITGTVGAAATIARGGSGNTEFMNLTYRPFTAGAYKASATAPLQSPTGFTVVAHFKPDAASLTGRRTLYSDQGNGGIALDIVDGRMQVQWHDGTGYQSVTATGYPIDTNWHYVVAAVTINPTTPASSHARIYVDGQERIDVSPIPGAQNLKNSGQPGCVAAECDGTGSSRAPVGEYFVGRIATVEVLNYPLWSRSYLFSQLNDGGWYAGLPSYFDFTPAVTDTPTGAYRSKYRRMADAINEPQGGNNFPQFNDMKAKVTRRISLPYLNDGFVYQGVFVGTTTTANDTMFMVGHYEPDPDLSEGMAIVPEVNITGCATGTCAPSLRRTYRLVSATGAELSGVHPGGVVKVGHILYVNSLMNEATGIGGLLQFDLSAPRTTWHPADAATGRPAIEDLKLVKSHTGLCGGASVSLDVVSNRLYCFTSGARLIRGYNLNADGSLPDSTPEVTWSIPAGPYTQGTKTYQLQGGAAYHRGNAGANPCFVLHFSGGESNPSAIHDFCPSTSTTAVRELSSTLATNGEGVVVTTDGMVWGITEGASKKMQAVGSASIVLAPWVWGIPRATLGIQ
ncbi:LamG-like jellyroll fold domain-containing protein [Corallococcus aberystwythensis]|uniref:LamG domain-containing protein n=1 Tax=Corallococcus aberystwythensis TaxID=2316722 RepID=A0A3A8R5S3_9BACT|nr:LamG-like jellyroll fold domain-containing protein [Corallococcus aberystwythensis]RKH74540.1 LamG domain-containing protein [Corallococcus aberystwythensis]